MKNLILLLVITISFINNSFSQKHTVLFVMSSADTLNLNKGKKLRQTGVFLNEFYLTYKTVSEAGYEVKFATPNGIVATIDNESIDDKYWENKPELKVLYF